jgi:carbon monoxide dehydrogenase subunit G
MWRSLYSDSVLITTSNEVETVIRFENSIEVEQSPAEVFEYVSNLDNLAEWQSGVIESRVITPPPMRVGTIFEEDAKVAFWRTKASCTVTELTRPRLFAFKATSSGPIEYEGSFEFQPSGSGTAVKVSGSIRLKGLWRLLQPLMASDIKRETRGELESIRRNLASRAARSAEVSAAEPARGE